MSKYLTLLKTKTGQIPIPDQPSKPSKGTFEGFEGDLGVRIWPNIGFVLDIDECAAQAEIGGEVPAVYARAFAEMQVRPLRTMSVDRWHEVVNDAGLFLDEWGPTAEKAGWTADDLFGANGIVWALNGKPLAAMDHNRAILPTGRRVDRPSSRRRTG
jgi:hypothetical protein